jgi:putative ribosome biogenesis GTPase RsgA
MESTNQDPERDLSPIKLIECDRETLTLSLNPEAVAILEKCEAPYVFVAVSGKLGIGKSTFLNAVMY